MIFGNFLIRVKILTVYRSNLKKEFTNERKWVLLSKAESVFENRLDEYILKKKTKSRMIKSKGS